MVAGTGVGLYSLVKVEDRRGLQSQGAYSETEH